MRRKINYPPFFEIEGAAFLWTNWASFGSEDRRNFNSSCMYIVLTSDGLGREIFCQGMYGNRLKNDIFFFSKFRSFLPYFYGKCLVKLSFLSSFFG